MKDNILLAKLPVYTSGLHFPFFDCRKWILKVLCQAFGINVGGDIYPTL